MNNEQYKSGWNLRVANANAKLPRDCKKNAEFLVGFWDCNSAFMKAVADAVKTGNNPAYPKAL